MGRGVEIFTVEEFQRAIPDAHWLGLVEGEYCWLQPVTDKAGVLIRSSIDRTGVSGAKGEDSIRIYPCECHLLQWDPPVYAYHLQGNPDARWVTRVIGWERRLQDMIQKLAALIERASDCPVCERPRQILKVKKQGPNRGRWFATCKEHKLFRWLDE
jgi:hypothetical protein